MQKLIIFDFDGVIADSEALSNAALAEAVTDLGVPTSLEDSYRLYMGTRSSDIIAKVEAQTGLTVPPDFADQHLARTLDRLTQDLRAVPGAVDYINAFAHVGFVRGN